LATRKETIKALQRQVSDQNKIYVQLQDQLGQAHIVQQDLEDEKTKLMEIIDKQKFDLDEARSGLNQAIYNVYINSFFLF
jgi:predicted  nucleic acid-binding Zn-ribbon protein